MCKDVIYWIWYSLKFPAGCEAAYTLLSLFDFDIKALYAANAKRYRELCGDDFKYADVLENKELDEAGVIYDYCRTGGYDIITVNEERYPSRLLRIDSRPILLYCKGTLPDVDNNLCISVVGTRRMTDYGRRNTYMICFDLARCGAVIVSGAALGIDGVAARAAIDAGGKTIAVLGCGIDVTYPKEHFDLIDEIAEHGAVITEYPPHTKPLGHNFPMRNRIISGLSLGTWVVEADLNSGSLITADYAIRQGRDLYALPGRVGELNSLGTNELIKQGATVITRADDIIGEYDALFPHKISSNVNEAIHPKMDFKPKRLSREPIFRSSSSLNKTKSAKEEKDTVKERKSVPQRATSSENTEVKASNKASQNFESFKDLSPSERAVCEALAQKEALTADEIAANNIPIKDVTVALTVLELKKKVKSLPGGKFILL